MQTLWKQFSNLIGAVSKYQFIMLNCGLLTIVDYDYIVDLHIKSLDPPISGYGLNTFVKCVELSYWTTQVLIGRGPFQTCIMKTYYTNSIFCVLCESGESDGVETPFNTVVLLKRFGTRESTP